MKKTLLTLLIAGFGMYSAFSQGTVSVYTINASFANNTSQTAYTSALNGVYDAAGTKTAAAAGGYYYALLVQSYNAGLTANPLDSNWSLGMMATNYLAGGIKGAGAGAGAPIAGWAAPSGSSYDTAGKDSFVLVGWSSNLGTTWSDVLSQLQSGQWSDLGYFGVSAVGSGFSGGGPNGLIAPSIFGASTGMPGGLANGITMYTTVPEPGTMALAALGGASLLLFRRRK